MMRTGTWKTSAAWLYGMAGLLLAGCGGGEGGATEDARAPASAESGSSLTAVELEQGIGPVRDLELSGIDAALATRGEAAFRTKCFACHRLDSRYVAPQLGNVLERRRPEFVMNMMLNPAEMVARHPVVQELMKEFMVAMPDQDITEEEARAILEYIRAEAAKGEGG